MGLIQDETNAPRSVATSLPPASSLSASVNAKPALFPRHAASPQYKH
jgi:hypothetical protein